MIWESWYWKQPLLEMADRLSVLKTVEELTEEDMVQIEKDILIGFYSVRKLIESPTKVTDLTKAIKIPVTWFPAKERVNWRNHHKIDKLYDFGAPGEETRDLPFVCGRIIHSFILFPEVNENGGLNGLLFTSDKDKDQKLYSITIETIIALFRAVGNDYPTDIRWTKDPETGEDSMEIS